MADLTALKDAGIIKPNYFHLVMDYYPSLTVCCLCQGSDPINNCILYSLGKFISHLYLISVEPFVYLYETILENPIAIFNYI